MLGSTGSPSTAAILLSSYLSSRNLSVMSAARSETVQNALREPHFGWMKLGDAPARQIFAAYVADNTNADRSLHLRFTSGNELRQRARAGAAGHAGAGAKRAGFEDTTAA